MKKVYVSILLVCTMWLSFRWPTEHVVFWWHFLGTLLFTLAFACDAEPRYIRSFEKKSRILDTIATIVSPLALISFPIFHKKAVSGFHSAVEAMPKMKVFDPSFAPPKIEPADLPTWTIIGIVSVCAVAALIAFLILCLSVSFEKSSIPDARPKNIFKRYATGLSLFGFCVLVYAGCSPSKGTAVSIILPRAFTADDSERYLQFYDYRTPFKTYVIVDVKLAWCGIQTRGVLDTSHMKGEIMNRKVTWEPNCWPWGVKAPQYVADLQ